MKNKNKILAAFSGLVLTGALLGSGYFGGGSGGGGTWGSITGTLSDQTDLQTAISAKYATSDMVSTATASKGVLRDANANFQVNAVSAGYATSTSGSVITLTVASPRVQFRTSGSPNGWQLPSAATLNLGDTFTFVNNSAGTQYIKDFSGTILYTMQISEPAITVRVTNIGSSAGVWSIDTKYSDGSTASTVIKSSALLGIRLNSIHEAGGGISHQGNIDLSTGVFTNNQGDDIIDLQNGLFGSGPQMDIYNGLLNNSGGTTTVDFEHSSILDSGTFTSVDGEARNLLDDSSNVVMDWSQGYAESMGIPNNTAASAGIIGQYISSALSAASAVTLTTATPKTVTSISLTAGDWDVSGTVSFNGTLTGTQSIAAIGTTTNSLTGTTPGDTQIASPTLSSAASDSNIAIPSYRLALNSTTTVYLISQATFTVGTGKSYGRISARRTR